MGKIKTEKIFLIGSNKTGTTSLTNAFKILGYNVCPEDMIYEHNSKYLINSSKQNYNLLFDLVDMYDVFEDRPWNHVDFYQILDKKFTGSKFILTVRDTENWVNSCLRWNIKVNLKNKWFYPLVSQICYGNNDFLSDLNNMKEKYENRNKEVIEYFGDRSNFLIMDLEKNDKWNVLCEFLGKKIPDVDFPHSNRTK